MQSFPTAVVSQFTFLVVGCGADEPDALQMTAERILPAFIK